MALSGKEVPTAKLAKYKFTNFSQKISTQLLTVLIICVILHIEQRKRERKREMKISEIPESQRF